MRGGATADNQRIHGTVAGGSGLGYLRNTIAHLDEMGIRDGPLHRILALAEAKARKRP